MLRRSLIALALHFTSVATAFGAIPVDELRKSFTIGGKPIPPEIFADFGDAMMSDSRPIVVTIDANAAIAGPLLYEGPEIAPGHFDLACAQTGGIPVRSGGQAGSLIVPAPRAETEV